jgi:diguanylate cyclase (GGDEF)-like protein
MIRTGGTPSRTYIGVPLILRERVIGVLSMQSYQPNAYTREHIYLIETIAIHAAIAVENARLYAEVQRLAIIDELTGLYNYRGLFELGPREIERARRFGRPLTALFFDIDLFRNFNNRYSHATGNLVLRVVSQRSRSCVRSIDLVARYGGEEFVILLPEADLATAKQVAERLRRDIELTLVPTEWGMLGVTISIGVANFTTGTPDLAALIDRANQAEHIAKGQGAGQTVVIGDEPAAAARG